MRVLGLDISTSCVGFSLMESNDLSLVQLGHWSLKKQIGLNEKADHISERINELVSARLFDGPVWIEEPAMRFTLGMSSAQTIIMLASFNSIVSYIVHSRFKLTTHHVKPGEARRTCGLSLTTKAKAGGASQKQQVYEQLTAPSGLLSAVPFPLTKTGKPKLENYDEADAYVVARHGAIHSR